MLRVAFALVLVACVGSVDDDVDDLGPVPEEEEAVEPMAEPEEPGQEEEEPPPSELPDVIDGVPVFQLPFPCGQVWSGQTRTNHSPTPSVDFNRTDDLGDPVLAAAKGVVSRVDNEGNESYGRWIEINHGNGYRTRYAHLATQIVTVNQTVKRGQQIGTLGNTGGSSGPHLHYEQRKDGVAVNARFNLQSALYYGTKSYTSQNGCAFNGVPGVVNTGGSTLPVRADASTSSTTLSTLADGASVAITCQKLGEAVTGTYGTSTLWDKIGNGYVPDAFVSTGSDGQVAPTCP